VTEWTPERIWAEADDAEKNRIVARALQHALARNYLNLPTLATYQKKSELGAFGAVVYFDLLERVGTTGYTVTVQPDYQTTTAVAGWLRSNPLSASPEVRRVIQAEVKRQELQDDGELMGRLKPFYRKQP
jgi:hypothetical protein